MSRHRLSGCGKLIGMGSKLQTDRDLAEAIRQACIAAALEAHEQALTQFRQQVADLDAKLQNYRASDHATLWAENERLKAEYDRLRSEHDQLVAQMGGAPGEARTGTTASGY